MGPFGRGILAVTLGALGSVVAVHAAFPAQAPRPKDQEGPIHTPYARREKLEIRKVTLSAKTVPVYSTVELTVDFRATYDNPFDAADVRLDARLVTPSGKLITVPGFLYRPYIRKLNGRSEVLTSAGEPSWRVRITPWEEGRHAITVVVHDRSGAAAGTGYRFTATRSPSHGFIGIGGRDHRYFEFDDGLAYYPIGANVCWGGSRGTFDYDDWFPAYGKAGCNYGRLWLSPQWTTFALERAGKPEEGLGLGQFDLANAWRVDYVLRKARASGLYLMLCIDSYNILRAGNGFPEWERTPHNAANGGPLRRPPEFWTDTRMDRIYRDKLRYLVARYGASPNVLSWELWNEVDGISAYRTEPVKEWHERMAEALRKLDPYDHLITTSFARTEGDPAIDRLPELDYVQTHHYGSPDLVVTLADAQAQKVTYGKPHYVGEIGADSAGARREVDPEGLQVHNPLWVSIATGASGGAAAWWWDSLIAPRHLYGLYTPAARFVSGIEWPEERMRRVTPRVEWRTRPRQLPRGDLALAAGPVSWSASEYNRPRTVSVTRSGVRGQLPLAGILHGTANHPELHNPVTFTTSLPWPSRLEVEVGDVSGYGGAALRVTIDGKPEFDRPFTDEDPGNGTLHSYAGIYALDVPAGKHQVVVENTGRDWMMASFRWRNAVEKAGPPLLAWASAGKNTAVAWARVEGRTWRRVCLLKQTVPPAAASALILAGLAKGRWKADLWDTWAGKILGRQDVMVPASGTARVLLPAVTKDIAVRLRREGAREEPRGERKRRGRGGEGAVEEDD